MKNTGRGGGDVEDGMATSDPVYPMPKSDPVYPILAGVLDVVPASRWTFARVQPNGDLVSLYQSDGDGGLAGLADELKRQRKEPRRARASPRCSVRSAITRAESRSCSPTPAPVTAFSRFCGRRNSGRSRRAKSAC